tara:strand:- start:1190 stop:1387 length:198 start_codon:yes stop_codon:yes gene_type:complete
MKVGDLVMTKQCVWYYGSEARTKRMGIVLEIIRSPLTGTIVHCWFSEIGYYQINVEGIELLEENC